MSIAPLDKLGELISQTGFDPALVMIIVAFVLALYPPFKRGVLDNRIEELSESIDYSLAILSAGFILAFYFQFGVGGVQNELLSITGGFILGSFVVKTISSLTGVK